MSGAAAYGIRSKHSEKLIISAIIRTNMLPMNHLMQNLNRATRVSIIVPVKNGMNYIEHALLSISQNIGDRDELVIVDDGSTDATLKFAKQYAKDVSIHLKVIVTNGIGPAAARNLGVKASVGKYIAFIDHDDYWPLNRINDHVAILDADSAVSVVMGQTQYVSSRETQGELARPLYHVHLGASTFRRSVFDGLGLFNPDLNFSEDHDFFLRVRESGLVIMPFEAISLYYRVHDDSMTSGKALHEMQLFKVILDSLRRRRLSNITLSKFPSIDKRT